MQAILKTNLLLGYLYRSSLPEKEWEGLHSKFNVDITHEYSIKIGILEGGDGPGDGASIRVDLP